MIIKDIKRIIQLTKLKGHTKLTIVFIPGFWAVLIYRFGSFFTHLNLPIIKQLGLIVYIPFKILIEILWGISISRKAQIGPGFFINHFGCIFIHSNVKIGKNCVISQEVTIGVKGAEPNDKAPQIGDNVRIGPGAKIMGPIKIGNNCIIGANAVVVKSFNRNSVIGGIPGKVIRKKL